MDKNFFQDVYEVVRLIPFGRVTSYGAISRYLGAKNKARMVGWAMNSAHSLSDIPAHRVVNQQGILSGKGHFDPDSSMQSRLEAEGIIIQNNKIRYFKKVFWDPSSELL